MLRPLKKLSEIILEAKEYSLFLFISLLLNLFNVFDLKLFLGVLLLFSKLNLTIFSLFSEGGDSISSFILKPLFKLSFDNVCNIIGNLFLMTLYLSKFLIIFFFNVRLNCSVLNSTTFLFFKFRV